MLRKDFSLIVLRSPPSVRVIVAVPGVANRAGSHGTLFWGALAGTYLAAAVFGFVLGGQLPGSRLLPFGHHAPTSTPLARVGLALREDNLQATPEAWSTLGADVDAVRTLLAGPARPQGRAPERDQARDVLDLVVALRGLKNAGNSDWSQAERLCRALGWPRCDRPALELLKARSRP